MNRRSGSLQLYRQRAGGDSKAVCPTRVRRCVVTNRAAQRRRVLIMRGFWLLRSPFTLRALRIQLFLLHACLARVFVRRMTRIALAIAAGATVQIVCMLYNSSILFIVASMCTTTTLILLHLLFTERPVSMPRRTIMSVTLPRTALPRPSRSAHAEQHTPMLLPFPETPMPATPLVRILETIDLSSTNVEHFLKTQAPIQAYANEEPDSTQCDIHP